MAKPEEIDKDLCHCIGKSFAFEALYMLLNSKPESKYDGVRNVLLSLRNVPSSEYFRDTLLEVNEEVQPGEDKPFDRCVSLRSVKQKGKDGVHVRISVNRMNGSLMSNITNRDIILKSFHDTIRRLIDADEHLSETKVIVVDGDRGALKDDIENAMEDKTISDLECDAVSQDMSMCSLSRNIGQGFARIYFFENLQSILNGLEERCASNQTLLPFLVVDTSEDLMEEKDLRLKAKKWIGTEVFHRRQIPEFIMSQIYQLYDSEVMIEHPEPIRTLKVLRRNGKLSQQEYKRECLSFRRTLIQMIRAKVDSGHIKQNQCSIYDGCSKRLADHILSCANKHGISMREASDLGINVSDNHLEIPNSCCTDQLQNFSIDGKDLDDIDLAVECVMKECRENVETRDVISAVQDVGNCDDDYNWTFTISPEDNVHILEKVVTPKSGIGELATGMVVAALKQENLISDEVKSRLTSFSRFPHCQAGLVLRLLLFILNLNITLYPSLAKAFEGLKQRARQSTVEEENSNSQKESAVEGTKPSEETATSDDTERKKAESKSSKTSLRGPEAKLQIISNILFKMIEDKNYYPYDFEVQLRKFIFENKQDVCKLRNKEGLTLLQAVVTNSRPQFFSPVFRAGCWKDLKPLKADSGPYEGKTAEEICTNARFKKVQKEMDTYTTWEKSLNQIHLAARKGDLAEVKRMLKFSQDLHNEPDSMECTSLYWAVVGGNVDIVKLLINLKVDHTKVNKRKESLLHIACIVGHTHLLTTLVKDHRMDWTVKDAAKKSALLRIAENGDDKSLAKLMKCGLRKDQLGPIMAIAGHYGRMGFLRKVIEDHGVDPGSKDEAGKSAFMRACEQGKLDVAKYLLTKGINICETDTRKRNVLHMAADGAGVEMVEFLINEIKTRKGDDVLRGMLCQRDKYIGGELCMLIRGKDKGRDSWHYVEVCRGLMDVFMKRTRSGTIDVAKYGTLLHSGWGIDPDEESAREIEQRFETRRNANLAEDLDVTPLHIAAFKDKADVAELLTKMGSAVNVRDKFGLTPLHVAAMRGNLAIVKGLLKVGAATDVLDNLIKTPVDVAEDNEHRDVASFIRSIQYLPVAQNFRERILPNIQRLIGEDFIRELQESERDVRTHLINTLRDLTIDINESLLALGSGPVLEESTPNDPSTKD